MLSPIDIHEFSTGINFQILDGSGRWVSSGFTGQYMNNTLAEQGRGIPPEVEQAISNRNFAVSEGAYTKEPAIIARDFLDSPWSVIAVVSRGEDEKGRSASFYRYFLCEEPSIGYDHGEDGISILLNWMTERRKEIRQWPQFHPQRLERSLSYQTPELFSATAEAIQEKQAYLQGAQAPYVWQAETGCVPLTLHGLTKVNWREGDSFAWAFNAGALEKPWSFTIISPASAKAESLIRRAIANPPAVRIAGGTSEEALNTAIKTLTTTSTVKPDAVKTLFAAAVSEKISDNDWLILFDRRGVKKALSHNFHNPEMVKIMTLRAIIVPSTLIEFLGWSGLLDKQKQPTEAENVLVNFQRNLSFALDRVQLAQRVDQSVDQAISNILMPALLCGKITPNDAYGLLSMKLSFWGKRFFPFLLSFEQGIEYIYKNATAISQSGTREPYESSLWYGIFVRCNLSNFNPRERKATYYDPLIHLLRDVGKGQPFTRDECLLAYRLASYLIHISKHSAVESKLYRKAFSAQSDSTRYLNEEIVRDVPLIEEVIKELRFLLDRQMKLWQVLILSGLTFAFGNVSGAFSMKYGGSLLESMSLRGGGSRNEADSNPAGTAGKGSASGPPDTYSSPEPSSEAIAAYDKTRGYLGDIVIRVADDFENQSMSNDIVAETLFNDVLKTNELVEPDYSVFLVEATEEQKRELVRALLRYENSLGRPDIPADGIIFDPDENTAEAIERQVRELIAKQSQS